MTGVGDKVAQRYPICFLHLDVPSEARNLDLRLALSNSFAFGGSNITLLMERQSSNNLQV